MKEITITYTQLLESLTSFKKLLSLFLRAVIICRIGKVAKNLKNDIEVMTKGRLDLFKKYGVKQPEGGYLVKEDGSEKHTSFEKEMKELMSETVTFKIPHITIADVEPITFNEYKELARYYEKVTENIKKTTTQMLELHTKLKPDSIDNDEVIKLIKKTCTKIEKNLKATQDMADSLQNALGKQLTGNDFMNLDWLIMDDELEDNNIGKT